MTDNFPTTSRYRNIQAAKITASDEKTIVYLRRRFLPISTGLLLAEHTVGQCDRLDNITAHYLGDPEQFWQVCDANNAMKPDDLTAEIGRRLRIPMP